MQKIILNRLKPQAEKIIAEEKAGFRAGRSTTEKIFNLRILCEKYFQHKQDLCRVFLTSRRPSTGFGMQLCGQPWRSTTSAPTLSESSKICMTRPLVPSSSTAALGTGFEQQLESDKDIYSHPPSSTYFAKYHCRRLRRSRRHGQH